MSRVLLVPDLPHWALDKGARDLVKYNASSLELEVKYFDDFRKDAGRYLRDYDLVFPLYMGLFFTMLKDKMPVENVATGIRSFVRWDKKKTVPPGYNAKPPRKIVRDLKRAVLVNTNSQKLWYLFAPHLPVVHTKYTCDLEAYFPEARPANNGLVVGWTGSLSNHPGKRGFHEFIEPACRELGIELKVQAKEDNFITDDAGMRAFYNSLDLYICASRVEGAGRPILEAAACGVPVMSTDVGIVPELVEHEVNGFVVDRTLEAFIERLAWVQAHREALPEMGARLRTKMEREFNWEHLVHQWTDFMRYAIQLVDLKQQGIVK